MKAAYLRSATRAMLGAQRRRPASRVILGLQQPQQGNSLRCLSAWSRELEPHTIVPASEIVNPAAIEQAMEETKSAAKDAVRVHEILSHAVDRALLKSPSGETSVIPSADPQHEFVLGLSLEEAATLLNLDPKTQPELMQALYDTALSIKERIYGNRIVLFAPLYLSNWCVNSCTYCAFRGKNKHIPRSQLTKEEVIAQVETLQKMGHRRLLLLTGEHPKYTFDDFLEAIDTVANVRTDPCGSIRRINVEIPALSVSDLRRLKATDQVSIRVCVQAHYTYCSSASFLKERILHTINVHKISPHFLNCRRWEHTHCFKKLTIRRCSSVSTRVDPNQIMNIDSRPWTELRLLVWMMWALVPCLACTIIVLSVWPCCNTPSI